ncbi:MBL fold metallo-hydrolase [Ichthyobacterium seriolicida]|uniref:Metallo-beta-lactamase family protein n=1 Tax=Ichthyobacterium seriolicida TaxID=242600 RepID=A0A1J1DX34_9FLAO|nr:MBL fold metallo-hydrolase [Ichthyobacterium seriolicida]BAV94418.1 metallo-beta-lactamase family protein [Ichthyobacterium seriolicida]
MKVEQIFTKCLSQMTYYIESKGEAAVIDPLRDPSPYLEKLSEDKAELKYIFLTHFHADFVAGHVDLSNETGAVIVYGPNANTSYDFHEGKDLEEFCIGDVKLKLLHTPGHTMESSSYLLIDKDKKTPYVFTGDCLFIGEVGRPDLAVKNGLTQRELAGYLFDSLREKIMTLSDDTVVYPAHGAGSACGKNISKETYDTIKNQKETNYALKQDLSKEEFIQKVTENIPPPPDYFKHNVDMNKGINDQYTDIIQRGTRALSLEEFKSLSEREDVLVIDTVSKEDYTKNGSIPGSWYFGIDGTFAPWIGTLIPNIKQKIVFLAEGGREREVVMRLSRVGYDNCIGYLQGGINTWIENGDKVEKIESISAEEFVEKLRDKKVENVIDVRKEKEYQSLHISNSKNLPLDFIHSNFAQINKKRKNFVHCKGGYRSLIACSILKSMGIDNVVDIKGGFDKLKSIPNVSLSKV